MHKTVFNLKEVMINNYKLNVSEVEKVNIDISLSKQQKRNFGICSFFAVRFSDLEKKGKNSDDYVLKKDTLQDLLKTQDGNRKLFAVNNIKNLVDRNLHHLIGGNLVKYYDPEKLSLFSSGTKDFKNIFSKTNDYRYQYEYRFVRDISDGENLLYMNTLKENIWETSVDNLS